MQTRQFPLIALGFGIVLGLVTVVGSTTLPLLTRLVVAEFAFFVTSIGAFMSFRQSRGQGIKSPTLLTGVLCGALAVFFLLRGIALWPL
ncbi:MAG: hypothetical protein ACU85U_04685 [Gammaproteobacteria bacterium]|jgi:hypothetical protein